VKILEGGRGCEEVRMLLWYRERRETHTMWWYISLFACREGDSVTVGLLEDRDDLGVRLIDVAHQASHAEKVTMSTAQQYIWWKMYEEVCISMVC